MSFIRPTVSAAAEGALTALDWQGDGTVRLMIVWQNPQSNGLPIYGPVTGGGPATDGVTYFYRCKPFRKDTSNTSTSRATSNARYWSGFFWGNSFPDGGEWTTHPGSPANGNNIFQWDTGDAPNTYYGFHPYPSGGAGAPDGIPQYPELSIESQDYNTHGMGSAGFISPGQADDQWDWGNWLWVMFTCQKTGSNTYEHEFYYQLNTDRSGIERGFTDSGWATSNPPHPCITFGQSAWVTYTGDEEFCGAVRGLIIVPKRMTAAQGEAVIVNNFNAGVKTTLDGLGLPNEWYLNMNPTTTDITDKGRRGNNPMWVGNGRPADVAGG